MSHYDEQYEMWRNNLTWCGKLVENNSKNEMTPEKENAVRLKSINELQIDLFKQQCYLDSLGDLK